MKKVALFVLTLAILASCMAFAGCGAEKSWTVVKDINLTHTQNTNIEAFFNENLGYTIGCNVGESWWTNDGGKTWTQAFGASICRFSIDIVNENLAWDGGDGDEVCYTKDGGKTWKNVTDFSVPGIINQVDFIDDKTGWVSSQVGLASTNDGGQTWTSIKLPEGFNKVSAMALRTAKDGYLLSNEGKFYTTKDGGQTWSVQDLGFDKLNIVDLHNQKGRLTLINAAMADIGFTDEKRGLIVFIGVVPNEGYKTWEYSTSDGGKTWSSSLLKMPEGFSPASLFMTSDGKYLTLSSIKKHVVVMKRG